MMMRGNEISSLWELEESKANALGDIPQNAYLLVRLYEILDLEPNQTEEEIRRYHV